MGIKFVYDSADQRDQLEQIVEKMMTDSLGPLIFSRLVKKPKAVAARSRASADEHLLAAGAGRGAGGEAGGAPGGQEGVRRARRAGAAAKWRATTGAIMKPWPRKPQTTWKPGTSGQLADDRIAVRADVVGAGPLAHDLDVAEPRHQLDERARHRGRERQPRAEADSSTAAVVLGAAARCRRPARRAATATRRGRSPSTVTIGFRNGLSGSVDRISWRCGRLGSDAPTSRATSGDQAPAAQTIRSAVNVPAGVVMRKPPPPGAALDRRDRRRRVDRDAVLRRRVRVAPQERPRKHDAVGRVVAGGDEAARRRAPGPARAPPRA